MDEARACARQGDSPCVIRALEGRSDSPRALEMLVAAYRTTGNSAASRRTMERYLARYPTGARADEYRARLGQ
jgi:hypothetical protein